MGKVALWVLKKILRGKLEGIDDCIECVATGPEEAKACSEIVMRWYGLSIC